MKSRKCRKRGKRARERERKREITGQQRRAKRGKRRRP